MSAKAIGLIGAATIAVSQAASGAPLNLLGQASRLEISKTDRDGKRLLIRIFPKRGWHTYWLNPGDAGAPPRLDWDRHPIDQTINMQTPEKIVADGITSFGFRQPVSLVANVSFDRMTTPRGTFSWVMCDGRSCLPERATFSLSDVPFTQDLEPKAPGMARDASWRVKQDAAVLTLPQQDQRAFATAYFFPLDQGALAPGTPQNPSQLARGGWRLTLRMKHTRAHPIPGVLSVTFRDGTCASYTIDTPSVPTKFNALGR